MKLGALEAGGTKMVMAVGDETMRIVARQSVPTRTPEETVPLLTAFFEEQQVDALGIGSFGPVDLNPSSPTYGNITKTPKLPWRDYPLLSVFREKLGVPCGFDTDVNCAALAEAELGAAQDVKNSVYITVGTGIGGGVISEGRLVHGLMHPEVGHILLTPHPDDPAPKGFCPYHDHCLEGLAAGPALEKRWGAPGNELPEAHPAWAIEAHYLAQMCVNLLMIVSPERIVLGGGVMGQRHLFPLVRRETERLLNGYLAPVQETDSLIVPPGCWPDSGLIGALLLAKQAAEARA